MTKNVCIDPQIYRTKVVGINPKVCYYLMYYIILYYIILYYSILYVLYYI
jgi:hypothetical protein